MERERYAEMVEFLEERFGIGAMGPWEAAARIYLDFEPLDTDTVWETLLAKLDSDPKAEFPPKPPALRAAVLERLRHKPRPALPETTERYDWSGYSTRTFREVRSLVAVVRDRHMELVRVGQIKCEDERCRHDEGSTP